MALSQDDLRQLKDIITEHKNNCIFSSDEIATIRTVSKMHSTMTEQFSKTVAVAIMLGIGFVMYLVYNLKGMLK